MWAGYKVLCIEGLYSVHTAVFRSCFYGEIVFSPPSWGICWHIQRTIPLLWPPFHQGCEVHLCYCYLLCRDLPCRPACEDLWNHWSTVYRPQGEKFVSYFISFAMDLHVCFNRLAGQSYWIFSTNRTAVVAFLQFHRKRHILRRSSKNPVGEMLLH